jgi:tRNA nucleotidyltransferase/poly(A) polymerase
MAVASLSHSQVYHLLEGLSPTAVLAAARITDSPLVAQRLEQYLRELRPIAPALDGQDLISMGVPQGPLVGEILHKLKNAKLDQLISTEAEERKLVRELLTTVTTPPATAGGFSGNA